MDVHKSNYIKMEDSGDEGADMEAGSSHFDILKDNAQKKIQETFDAIMELEPVIKVKKYSKTLVAVVSFFLLTMLISIVISYSKSSNHGLGTYTTINRPYKSDMSQVPANFTGLAIYGSLLDEQDELARSPRGAITLVFDSHTERFPAGQIMASPDLLFTFKTGNPITYPFDEYESDFFIMGTWWNPDKNETQRIPISLSLMTNMEGWQVNADLKDASHGKFQVITAEINMYRGPTQRFFSLFIGSLMWLLGGSVFWLAFTLCLRKRKVEPPTIAVTTSMLFALPAVRNVQPGNPPIGCTADFIAFFWGLGLITAASLILILNYIKTHKGEPWAPSIVKKGVQKGQSAVVVDFNAPESVSRAKGDMSGHGEEIPLHALKSPVRYTTV